MGKYDSLTVVKDFDLDNCSDGVVNFNGKRENIKVIDERVRREKELDKIYQRNQEVMTNALIKAYEYSLRECKDSTVVPRAWSRVMLYFKKIDDKNNKGGALMKWACQFLIRYDKAMRLGQWS